MDWNAIGALGEVAGAIGVILTLIYLASQLRQNTSMMRNTAAQATAAAGREVALATMSSPETVQALVKSMSGEKLTAEEQIHYRMWCQAMFRAVESYFMHWESGLVPEEFWLTRLEALKTGLNPQMKSVWIEARPGFHPDFAAALDDAWPEAKI